MALSQGHLCGQACVVVLTDLRETPEEAVGHVWITRPLTPVEVLVEPSGVLPDLRGIRDVGTAART